VPHGGWHRGAAAGVAGSILMQRTAACTVREQCRELSRRGSMQFEPYWLQSLTVIVML
jgi:hypothetical protein